MYQNLSENLKKHIAYIADILIERSKLKVNGKRWSGDIHITVNFWDGGITGTDVQGIEAKERKE